MRLSRYLTAFLLLLFILAGIGGVIISVFYEDRVEKVFIRELNKQLNTKVVIGNVKLHVFRKFPDASIQLSHVLIESAPEYDRGDFSFGTDTLAFIEHLFFQFNLRDIFLEEYRVKNVHADQGDIRIYFDEQGKGNYRFWKEKPDSQRMDFRFALDGFRLTSCEIRWENLAKNVSFRGRMEKMNLDGNFSRADYLLKTRMSLVAEKLTRSGICYLRDDPAVVELHFQADSNLYSIHRGRLEIGDLDFKVDGNILHDRTAELDLVVRGNNIGIEEITERFAGKALKVPAGFRGNGMLDFMAGITGRYNSKITPHIEAGFSLKDGWMETDSLQGRIGDLSLTGEYSNGPLNHPKSSKLNIKNFSFEWGASTFKGNCMLENLSMPVFRMDLNALLEHGDIEKLVNDPGFSGLSGSMAVHVAVAGVLGKDMQLNKEKLADFAYRGEARFQQLSFTWPRPEFRFDSVNGLLHVDEDFRLDNVGFLLSGNDVRLTGRVDHALDRLFGKKTGLWADVDVFSRQMDLNRFGDREKKGKKRGMNFPENLHVKARIHCTHFRSGDFEAAGVAGKMSYKPKILVVHDIRSGLAGGSIRAGGGMIRKGNGQFMLNIRSELNDIDIHDFFLAFRNFGQEFIQAKHLQGNLTGKVNFTGLLDPFFKLDKGSIQADADFLIRDGEMIGFEPMMDISRFVELSELEHIRFSTLENQIFIRDSQVIIPLMDIQSSAFTISGSGQHGFNKQFDYRIKVLLSEILSGKVCSNGLQKSDFGYVEDDGLGRTALYLSVSGTPGDIHVKYDPQQTVRAIRDRFREEKIELKKLLNKELGMFSRDTTVSVPPGIDEEESPEFIIEWEEDPEQDHE